MDCTNNNKLVIQCLGFALVTISAIVWVVGRRAGDGMAWTVNVTEQQKCCEGRERVRACI